MQYQTLSKAVTLGLAIIAGTATAETFATAESYMAVRADQAPVLSLTELNSGLLAVGDRGHILVQEGDAWRQVMVPTRTLLTAVTHVGERAWAVGHDAVILSSDAVTQQWRLRQQLPERDKPLLDVLALSSEHILAVGAYGLMFRSLDGGQSWQEEFHDELLYPEDREYLNELKEEDPGLYLDERSAILPHFNRIRRLSDERLVLMGELGLMALSDNDGRSWYPVESFYDGSLYELVETAAGTWLAAGLRGHIFRSEDQGESWQEIDSGVDGTINQGRILTDGRIALVANGGYLLISDDDGQSFTVTEVAKGQDLVALAQTQDGEVAIAGSDGIRRVQLPR
ncbi:WD40/YVTN/BNR-like repeat-containing protein [Ferrimonas gelatinilytica]|uniref:YCF48-related protein n=1 Tax=Ferrimonas gelatinilytica TaxID=1255257 RepID=A0ABP9RX43_9GAMM